MDVIITELLFDDIDALREVDDGRLALSPAITNQLLTEFPDGVTGTQVPWILSAIERIVVGLLMP